MLKSSGAVVTLLTVLTYVITDLPSKSAAALTVPALSAAQTQERIIDEVKACKPCRILCKKGYVCKCNRCVGADTQCRPQAIMCKKGYVYKCNQCVRRRK
jgi:hypothetical protein